MDFSTLRAFRPSEYEEAADGYRATAATASRAKERRSRRLHGEPERIRLVPGRLEARRREARPGRHGVGERRRQPDLRRGGAPGGEHPPERFGHGGSQWRLGGGVALIPSDEVFRANQVTTGTSKGHSEYWDRDTDSFRNQAAVVAGQYGKVKLEEWNSRQGSSGRRGIHRTYRMQHE